MIKQGTFLFAFLLLFATMASAQLQTNQLCAQAVVTSIDPTSVKVDEEFTVGVEIENCGQLIPDFVTFKITHLSEDLVVKEPLVTEIGSLAYSNSKRFLVYHIRTTPDATPGEYVIKTQLTYGSGDNQIVKDMEFSVTVTSDEAELALASAKTNPVFPEVGNPITLTLRIENFGKGDANSVKADLTGLDSFTGSKKSFLGELAANDDGILTFNLIPQQAGTYNYNLVVTFRDDFGTHEYTESLQLVVAEKQSSSLGISIGVIVLVIIIIFVTFRLRKRKKQSHVIEQLSKRGG